MESVPIYVIDGSLNGAFCGIWLELSAFSWDALCFAIFEALSLLEFSLILIGLCDFAGCALSAT